MIYFVYYFSWILMGVMLSAAGVNYGTNPYWWHVQLCLLVLGMSTAAVGYRMGRDLAQKGSTHV